jgi:hypothetical protein
MISPNSLHRVLPLLACLPYDACNSVAGLYECLVFLSEEVAPAVTWKVHYLATGFLLPNVLAQTHHTHAVSLLLSNFRRLVLLQRPPNKLERVQEKDWLTALPVVKPPLPLHELELADANRQKPLQWLVFLSSADEKVASVIEQGTDD